MGRIVVHEFIALDGVVENPAWTMDYPFDPAMGGAIGAIMQSSKALLLGRKTYELFAPTWSTRSGEDDPGAPFMNDSPKYIVSGTLKETAWSNSTVVGSYSPETIRSVKAKVDGDIYVSGSVTLVQGMLADRLVDELHLFVFPLTLGKGQRLFREGGAAVKFTPTGTDVYENGAMHLTLRPAD